MLVWLCNKGKEEDMARLYGVNVHEDHIAGIGVAMGEDVSALDSLWVEAKDIIDAEDGNVCR